jgi:4-hydroxy-tetrahydrodipicolinate synthase
MVGHAVSDLISDRVVPAVPVPFGSDGEIDAQLQDAYVAWMAEQPIGGVAVWAHTGRGMKLTDDQRESVMQAWRSGLAGKPIVCGVGVPESIALPSAASSLTDAVLGAVTDVAEGAVRNGADAALAHPPKALAALPDAEERMLDYHRAICSSGVPVIAFFLYEAAGGVSYSPRLIERIVELDGVIGIKVATLDSVMTYQDIIAVVEGIPGVLPITGEDRFLGYSLTVGSGAGTGAGAGARSALIGLGAALTDRSAALLEARASAAWDRFQELTSVLDGFARATFRAPMEGYVQRMLWALEADGVFPREAFDPWCPGLASDERDRIFAAVRALRSR